MEFKLFGKSVEPSRKDIVKTSIALVLYILFLVWVKSWMGIIAIPFIVDCYITRIIPWKWWKNLKSKVARIIMSWVDAIVFALVAVYFVHTFFFQNYVIPTSSLEKSLLVGDYLFVSKVNYGPRKPQTPLSMPLTQHTMPVLGCKSYIDALQWDYERVAGLEQIERGDIVVFNYPAGDIATTNPAVIDLHTYCYSIGRELNNDRNSVDTLPPLQAHALYEKYYNDGFRYIQEHPDEFGEILHRPVDRRENYVKRCIALPGETLEIKDREIYLNGSNMPLPLNAQFNYNVVLTRPLTEEQRRELGISKEDLQNLQIIRPQLIDENMRATLGISHSYLDSLRRSNWSVLAGELPLTNDSYKKLKANSRLCKNISIASPNYTQGIYPQNSNTGWTVDNYGPVWVPKRGETIELTPENIAIYERPIVAYEGNTLEIKDNKFYINGKPANSYTFKMDYYWMMGDNRHNSADSRSWGFVPEDHIVGKAMFVWLSLDKDRSLFQDKIRWNRMFRSVSSFD